LSKYKPDLILQGEWLVKDLICEINSLS
jgi:hypothetical protein